MPTARSSGKTYFYPIFEKSKIPMQNLHSLLHVCLMASIFSLPMCQSTENNPGQQQEALPPPIDQELFADYWYQGQAELTSFELDIMRYGELRKGEALLIFVTEEFSGDKQVKLDNPGNTPQNEKITVLKLNDLWKFKTGLYDYSMMNSVFTPVSLNQFPKTLKVTTSSQDWCGHGFTQINETPKGYQLQQLSYFESDGDLNTTVKPDLLEDELWTRIRINPASIPQGQVQILPGGFFARLQHEPQEPRLARIRFESSEASTECIVEYLHLNRTLKIAFDSAFPYRILSWTESSDRGLQVKAVRKRSMRSAYWQQNSEAFSDVRDSLLLRY